MMNYLNTGLLQSLVAIILIVSVDLCAEFFVFKKIHSKKKRARSKAILRYILFFISIFILAKIWVEGFGHLLAFIGFISAALTIAQKENILNFTGGFIISWRHSFGEGDYVKISDYQGVVKDLGLFSFTLEEINPDYSYRKTGRHIKLPNSLVTLHPFITFTSESVAVYNENIFIPFRENLEIEKITEQLEEKLKLYFSEIYKKFSYDEKKIYEKTLKKEQIKNPIIDITLDLGEDKGYRMSIQYYSLVHEVRKISSDIRNIILVVLKEKELLAELSFN